MAPDKIIAGSVEVWIDGLTRETGFIHESKNPFIPAWQSVPLRG